ncbi:ABC transporter ATP-binding protein [Pandoraea apista]|uniref:ABC transporter ATP-binding protein n=1 Tax=Pandoraea apista TaxID=93218 RepID=UPI00058ABC05|nr:ABC transporter ATP-binding protein [Pandoraea apista]AJE98319.1 multidrug ABC transporter ATPase [Pandoraea apista]AKH72372.1 multidrug ABC transporter ATPase [Pandoraea apista]AKI60763.1 multidrug ABC transporter ATPase [Pandoraea apista]
MLRFENLTKRFGTRTLFENLHFDAQAGCVALSDENGSGKSTLLGMLAGTLEADDGDIWLDGHSLRDAPLAAKAALAYVPDDCLAYPFQTGRALLDLVASAKKTRVDASVLDLAHRFGLAPHMEKRFEQMSLGTRRKFFLSATLIGAPRVIIADEPGNGLDAAARAVLIDLFTTLGKDRCVFFSSHDPELTRACHATTVGFADLGQHPAS